MVASSKYVECYLFSIFTNKHIPISTNYNINMIRPIKTTTITGTLLRLIIIILVHKRPTIGLGPPHVVTNYSPSTLVQDDLGGFTHQLSRCNW